MDEAIEKFCERHSVHGWSEQMKFLNEQWGMFCTWLREEHQPKPLEKQPDTIVMCNLEVVVMPNGEVISLGKTVGWFKDLQKYLTPKQ